MNITEVKHEFDETSKKNVGYVATIDGEVSSVPLDAGNRHYIEIQRQVKEGTLTIKDAD
tara:strand:+ start:431 stop:607 length:177 start_codon:yes stop_codon:yes gene_type:complete